MPLPDPPPLESIDGYALKEQKFKRQVYPPRLKSLENRCSTIGEIHDMLEQNYSDYEDEINWIKRQWDYRLNGYWFFNNGKPTYIDGAHFFYLNYFYLDNGLPEYRSRDRKFFLFSKFCATDTKLADGIEMGRRVCYGFAYPKHRREGATYKAEAINYELISRLEEAWGGIQSMDATSGKKVFVKHLVAPWRRMPFFFTPLYDGTTNPRTLLAFDAPAKRIGGKGSVINIERGLGGGIIYADTASRDFFDGDKLYFYHQDEIGKTTLENVSERHDVVKKCLAQGNGVRIHGFTIGTSTVGEMTQFGGRAFKKLCMKSMYSERNQIGQTSSGMYILFMPAFDGLEGFIDIFGDSVIEDPTEEDLWRLPNPERDVNGQLIGAKRFLQSVRDDLLLREDDESLKDYEEEIRLHPMKFSECFITAGAGSGLNLKKINNRIKELEFNDPCVRGDFEWTNGFDSDVEFVDNPNGRFNISFKMFDTEANQRYRKEVLMIGERKLVYYPSNPLRFTASADPFKFRKTEHKRMSDGAGVVFMNRDMAIDTNETPISEWQTHKTVCTYKYRPPTPEEYAEDMLKMCVYYGAMMFPEINVPVVWDKFTEWGFEGYLKFSRNIDGTYKKTPGFNTVGQTAQEIFNKHKAYIELHSKRENHIEVLLECKEIGGIEELTDFDLFVAVGGAYIGAESDSWRFFHTEEEVNQGDLGSYFSSRKY